MKRIYCTTILCVFLSIKMLAQTGGLGMYLVSSEKQGDKYFENYAYLDALEAYQKAHEKAGGNDQLKLKIAESYRMLNQPVEAEKWFSEVEMKERAFRPEHLWYYAEALSSAGKYQEAGKWYALFQESAEKDSRVSKKMESIKNQSELKRKNAAAVSIELASFNSEAADFSPAYYQDGLVFVSARNFKSNEKLFLWDKSGFLDVFYQGGKGNSVPEKFDKQINSVYHEGPLVFYQQGTKLIFTRNNFQDKIGKSSNGITKLKLYTSEKTEGASWTQPEPLPFNSDEFSTGHPAISSDGTTLYFASDRPGGFGGTDLYKVEFAEGEWQTPVNLGEGINTEGNELFPFLRQDQELYFASNGHGGLGGLDVFGLDLSQGINGKIVNVGAPINSQFDDFALILNEAGGDGYFSSNRPGGAGNDDLYSFKTSKSLLKGNRVSGKVLLVSNNTPLEEVEVQLLDAQGQLIKSTQAGADGRYQFELETGKDYQLKAVKADFTGKIKTFAAAEQAGQGIEMDLYLTGKENYSMYAMIRDEKTKEVLEGVQITLTDKVTGKLVLEEMTGSSGDFLYVLQNKKPQDRIRFQLRLKKEGYLSKTITYESALKEPGQIKLHELMKFSLDKVNLGMDLGKLAGVQAVYFDLGKHNIRPDAAAELDKVVAILKENPGIVIELGSHTDARGQSWTNLSLSDRRANASANYIISQGIDKSRVFGRGFGESEITNHCTDGVSCSEEEHQQNRRTEFMVIEF